MSQAQQSADTGKSSTYKHSEHYLKDDSFSMMPMTSLDTADFSGRAALVYKDELAKIDLIIHHVNFAYSENHQVTPHMGDTFSTVFFGKAPLEINVQATLPDSLENFGKTNLMDAYKNYYRASAVARTGIAPTLRCKGLNFTGPFTKLTVSEQSDGEDHVLVVFNMLVMQMLADGDNSQVSLDYVHGMDSVLSDDEESTALQSNVGGAWFTSLKNKAMDLGGELFNIYGD